MGSHAAPDRREEPVPETFRGVLPVELWSEYIGYLSILDKAAKIDHDGVAISSRLLDPAHVLMVDVRLGESAFTTYKASRGTFGVDLAEIASKLKLGKKKAPFTIAAPGDRDRVIYATARISGEVVAVDTSGMTSPKTPNLKLPASAAVDVGELTTWLKDAQGVSDHLMILISPDGVTLTAEGETAKTALTIPAVDSRAFVEEKPATARYSLDYVQRVVKRAKGSDDGKVYLELGTNYPVKMDWEWAAGLGSVSYLLAPRIENEI